MSQAAAQDDDGHRPEPAIALVPWDDERAARLRTDQQIELAGLYDGEPDIESDLPAEQMLATALLTVDGEPAACGSLREAHRYGEGYGELKRMYVRPEFRRRGLSRAVLAALEQVATEAGFRRLILETGVRQTEAVGLYRSSGYRRIPRYGPYVDEVRSICYARWLVDAGTRVLVLSGTMGAGKTTVASAVADLLRERRQPHAWIDADVLCQVWPTDDGDPYAQDLLFESLAAIAPGLSRRELKHVVVARVVEDPDDRERYELAFDGAEVAVVRLSASEATRVERLTEREPAGYWIDLALARTRELDAVLNDLDLDDVVVDNDGPPPSEVAARVLRAMGW